MRDPKLWRSLAGAATAAVLAASSAGAEVRSVVEYGDPAPGTSESLIAFGRAVLNDAGTVVFEAAIPNSNRLWRHTPAGLEQLAAVDEVPIGSPGGASIVSFDELLLAQSGEVATRIRLSTGDEGYFASTPGGLVTLAVEGASAPGTSEVFQSIRSSMHLSDAGAIAFFAVLDTFTDPTGIWVGGAGGVELLARQGQTAPGSSESFLIIDAFPRIAPSGLVGFASVLFGLTGSAGVWTGTPGALSASFVTAPSDYRGLYLSDDEELAFLDLSPPGPARIRAGLPGDLRTVFSYGDDAPGLPGGTTIAFGPEAPDLRMNVQRQVAFRAMTDEVGPREGLWSEGAGTLELLALEGEPAPGTGGLIFQEILGFEINDLGQTAFLVELDQLAGRALYVALPNGRVRLVMRDGGVFVPAPGEGRPVNRFQVELESARFLEQRPRGGFNSSGELAVSVLFGFGDAGVFVVPEPAGAASGLAFACLAALARARSRRRRPAPAARAHVEPTRPRQRRLAV